MRNTIITTATTTDNLTESRLSFRTAVQPHHDNFEQSDFDGASNAFGLTEYGVTDQPAGSVIAKQGLERCFVPCQRRMHMAALSLLPPTFMLS